VGWLGHGQLLSAVKKRAKKNGTHQSICGANREMDAVVRVSVKTGSPNRHWFKLLAMFKASSVPGCFDLKTGNF
jgi:hypothetical protein